MSEEATEGVVLRRRPYSETSLIVALLTRDAGMLHLVVRGGARRAKGGRDVIDLLRLVQVRWKPAKSGDLHTARSLEVVDSFEGVAREPELFDVVGWLSRFLLNHSESDGQQPQAYAAMVGLLRRICKGSPPSPAVCWTAVMIALAHEEGILPHHSADHDRRFAELIAAICDVDREIPDYDEKTWLSLRDWTAEVHIHSGHALPNGWRAFGA
jgi:DNA repair protein RecO